MKQVKLIKNYPGWKPKLNLVEEISRMFDKND